MKQNPKAAPASRTESLVRVGLLAVFCTVFSYVLQFSVNLHSGFLLPLAVTVVSIAVLWLLSSIRRGLPIAGIAAAAVLILWAALPLRSSLFDFFRWFIAYSNGTTASVGAYFTAAAVAVGVLTAIGFFLLGYRFRIDYATSALSLALLVWGAVSGENIPRAPIYILAAFMVLYYLLAIFRSSVRKTKITSQAEIMAKPASRMRFSLFILPAVALIMIILIALPKNSYPLQIRAIDNLYNRIYDSLAVLQADRSSAFSTAYQITGNDLYGDSYPNDIHVMDVSTEVPSYLKCEVKDKYTGFSMADTITGQASADADSNEAEDQKFELQSGTNFLSPDAANILSYVEGNAMTIVRLRQAKVNYLFVPTLFDGLSTTPAKASIGKGGQVSLDRKVSKGYTYTFNNITFSYGNSFFQNLLRQSHKGIYSDSDGYGNSSSYVKNRLIARADTIYKEYAQVDGSVTQRVRDLASQISGGQQTDYDKVRAIETYLAQSEHYTLTPQKPASGQNFVDYFLFTSHEGYCTAYATSMVEMVRSIGLPARECEGYSMPDRKNDTDDFYVTNRNAHAWVEVYFEGFGWVPFEPTTPYNDAFYKQSADFLGMGDTSSKTPSTGTSTETIHSQIVSYYASGIQPVPMESSSAPDTSEHKILNMPIWLFSLLFLALLAILAALAVLIVNTGRYKSRVRMRKTAPLRVGIVGMYGDFIRSLSYFGILPAQNETVYELRARLAKWDAFFQTDAFSRATDIFVEARYGQEEPTEDDFAAMLAFRKALDETLVKKVGKFRFFALRYFNGAL